MKRGLGLLALTGGALVVSSGLAAAGGAWVPKPGDGYVYLGFSRKTAGSSWRPSGEAYDNVSASTGKISYHDFRYIYLTLEVGLVKNLSLTATPTWLYGLEGPKDDYEKNTGLSDAWVGLKYQVRGGAYPMAAAVNLRTPYFYDLPGPYNRHLFDSDGEFRGVSPEWRGLLKHDFSVGYLVSHSFAEYRAWWNLGAGHTWREGAPANQFYADADVGYPLPFGGLHVKAASHLEVSLGQESPRQPDDRFGSSANNNFNKASYWKLGAAVLVPFGNKKEWALEVGYNQWVWGRSARRYKEPYISVGRSF
jgi:hypothetical protein